MAKIDELLRTWRGIGPVEWCESKFGWIGEDARPIKLTDWQHAILTAWWSLRFVITTLGISNVKKTGKTLVNAALVFLAMVSIAWRAFLRRQRF